MVLQDIDIRPHISCEYSGIRVFYTMCCTMENMYVRFLNKEYLSGAYQKINICLHYILLDKIPPFEAHEKNYDGMQNRLKKGIRFSQNMIEPSLGVLYIHRRFDFDSYFKQTESGKKRMILDELHAGVLAVAEHFAWDAKPLHDAYQKCLDADLQNHWYAKKLGEKSSPDRKHKAAVWVEYELTEIRLFLHLFDKQKQLIHSQLFYTLNGLDETTMYPDDVMPILHGKLTWQKNEVVVTDKKGNEIARIAAMSTENAGK